MNPSLSNLLAWCVQIAIITVLCAGSPWLLRLRIPRARLWYWHAVLLLCLALPIVEPWARPAPTDSAVTVTTGPMRVADHQALADFAFPWSKIAGAVLASGIALRLLWLGLGLYRLRGYRVAAIPFETVDQAAILVSKDVASPVTFGLRHPVVLLPERFASLSRQERDSILCHELIHVRRHDWAITVCEELVRSIFWFHPAIWWLLGRIQLSREQVVDQEVILQTGDSTSYLDALLAIASLEIRADLAPAPLFLKKSHLRQRVESIVSGVTMTKRALLLPLAAAFVTLPLVIGIAAWQFPLRAASQEAADDMGVEVQLGAAKILHRTGIAYPEEARAKHVSGTVVVGLTLNDKGEVTDAAIVSGPQELRRAVMQSVLNWHFSQDGGPVSDVQVAVHFEAGKEPVSTSQAHPPGISALNTPHTIEGVDLDKLPAALRDKVTEACGLTATSTFPAEDLSTLAACLRNVDEHIRTQGYLDQGKWKLSVILPGAQPASQASSSPLSIRVGGNVQAANILQKVTPPYPPEAKQARIQGTVRFNATIGPDGTVKNLVVVSGHPTLVQSAMEAVRQWVYKPTLLNGNPVEVITTIDVNYTLNQ